MAPLYVKVPRDLSRVKSKFLFNLTKRQLLCFTIAALIGLPVFFLLKKVGSPTLSTLGMMVVMLPMFLLAMYERNGQPLEVILKLYIQAVFIRPKIRPYQTNNDYMTILEMADAQKEVKRIVQASTNASKERSREEITGKSHKNRKKTDSKDHRPGKQKK